jgi:hypothetical protein
MLGFGLDFLEFLDVLTKWFTKQKISHLQCLAGFAIK